ncbi:MAG: autotransporter outer membrane beta-barrel domain-containing protein [Rhizobiales bacterium]|nr:autotransporter outer membrane beta-barrel domain-containing protein [Hyphomicrobiales bacterium]
MHSSSVVRSRLLALLTTSSAVVALSAVQPAHGQCVLMPTPGDDTLVCSSGTFVGNFSDTQGNNTLLFPTGGSGTVDGSVSFGDGADRVEMHSGTITAGVTQGDGDDSFIISNGTVVGEVSQNNGADTFVMTGGTIGSLAQGSQLDTAEVHGGRIIGLFFAGDFFTMTGGRIGQVNLEQANNEMRMSGGIIDDFVIAAQHNDLLELSGGSIGGTVNLGTGNNTILVTGGSIGGDVLTGSGTDRFTWDTAGFIGGTVNVGAGNDSATLRNLSEATLSSPLIDGGPGSDELTFDNTSATTASRYQNWETVALNNGSEFTLDGSFVLGDAGTGTGSFAIDATSTLFAGNGANASIQPFTAGQLVTVTNEGRIDLTNGTSGATDSLTIAGNYAGAGGQLAIQTSLGADNSPSDKLVISGGAATGSTGISVTNAGGSGGITTADGILAVQAANGATTAPGSFSLTGPVAAGAFEYFLFRSGVSDGSQNNWYLRSTLVAPQQAPGEPTPVPAPGTPPLPTPAPGAAPVPLYRPEVAVYSALPAMARQAALTTLGTFHERQGEQGLLRGVGSFPGSWGRVFGQHTQQAWSGTVSPDFEGTIAGLQVGQDLYAIERADGHRDRFGFFVGHARTNGDVTGFALGQQGFAAGKLGVDSTSFGGYWTHLGPSDWYVDAVAMGTLYDGNANSHRGVSLNINGTGFTGSLEAGAPIALGAGLTLEPQAQIVWQRLALDQAPDRFSSVAFSEDDVVSGRLGARLAGQFAIGAALWRPYLKANLWHGFSGADTITFADVHPILTDFGGTAVEVGGGVVGKLAATLDVYATAGYTAEVDGDKQRTVTGNLGLRMTW